MSDERRKANLWLWGPAPLVLLLAIYVGGYFVLSNTYTSSPPGGPLRCFGLQFACTIYWPAGWLESKIRRE